MTIFWACRAAEGRAILHAEIAGRIIADHMADSVSLDALVEEVQEKSKGHGPSVKLVVALFLIFLFVVSDVFKSNVIDSFGGASKNRGTTQFGTVLQGIFLVLFYIAANYLIDHNIL